MGMLLRFDPDIGMCRSVGDWPNGVLIVSMENPCDPQFAVDWKFPVKKVDDKEEGTREIIPMPVAEDGVPHLQPISMTETVQACETLNEAVIVWTIACEMLAQFSRQAGEDPHQFHIVMHLSQFLFNLHDELVAEKEFRDDEEGRRISDD